MAKAPGFDQFTNFRVERPSLSFNPLRWSSKEWLAVSAAAAFLLFLGWSSGPTADEKELLRRQFRLPTDVELSEIDVPPKLRPYPTIEGVVQFSVPQLRAYVAQLDDPGVWRPLPIAYGGTVFDGPYAPDALLWKDPRSTHAIAWGSLSATRAQAARNARLLCFSVRDVGGDIASAVFRGEPCAAGAGTGGRAVHVQGLIDLDSRSLHMVIRGTPSR